MWFRLSKLFAFARLNELVCLMESDSNYILSSEDLGRGHLASYVLCLYVQRQISDLQNIPNLNKESNAGQGGNRSLASQ